MMLIKLFHRIQIDGTPPKCLVQYIWFTFEYVNIHKFKHIPKNIYSTNIFFFVQNRWSLSAIVMCDLSIDQCLKQKIHLKFINGLNADQIKWKITVLWKIKRIATNQCWVTSNLRLFDCQSYYRIWTSNKCDE